MSLRNFFEGTTRDILFTCPTCSSSNEIPDQPLDTRALEADGFKLIGDADNAEYDALVRAAAELGRVANVSPLAVIEIPEAEGFRHEGETRFGFWAVSGDFTDAGFERFASMARSIVNSLNRDRSTAILLNINPAQTQAIVHGIIDE